MDRVAKEFGEEQCQRRYFAASSKLLFLLVARSFSGPFPVLSVRTRCVLREATEPVCTHCTLFDWKRAGW